jgi:ABC-type polysaccharide/polyol phosphate transport system ATPase subunit
VKVNGKITSFLEPGVGFRPDLTAKENIYVYGAVMRTILFVSHDMNSVRRFCKKALLLRHGE